jgi:hypothetical protein
VSLPRLAEDELAKSTEKFSAGEKEGTLVLLIGTSSGRGMGGGPFAGGGSSAPPALAQKKAADAGIAYDVPPEWKPARPDAISIAAFTPAEGDEKCRITIASAGGDLLMNVNRWRDQIGLAKVDAADLADVTKSETILGVMAAVRGQTWFVKLRGESEIAAREKPRFEAFVKSLKMK